MSASKRVSDYKKCNASMIKDDLAGNKASNTSSDKPLATEVKQASISYIMATTVQYHKPL